MLAAMCLMLQSYSRGAKMALLLEQSPVDGGAVEPGAGVHRLETNSQITLRAVPKEGYQFVMWLGDVDEPDSPVTETFMDSPKIVIALFERSQYESIEAADLLGGGPGGGGALTQSAADISSSSGGGGGAKRPGRIHPLIETPEEQLPDDFPVPDEGQPSDFPVPDQTEVPEPATVIILISGLALIRLQSRRFKT